MMKKSKLIIVFILLIAVLPAVAQHEGQEKLSLRANLLRWATLTPDAGLEFYVSQQWSLLLNGTWTSWQWKNKERRYALWEIRPEVRRYIGQNRRFHVGVQALAGQFNYKFAHEGKEGTLAGGALALGYKLPLGGAFALDASLGAGVLHANYDRYVLMNGVRVKSGNDKRTFVSPTDAAITLVWQLK